MRQPFLFIYIRFVKSILIKEHSFPNNKIFILSPDRWKFSGTQRAGTMSHFDGDTGNVLPVEEVFPGAAVGLLDTLSWHQAISGQGPGQLLHTVSLILHVPGGTPGTSAVKDGSCGMIADYSHYLAFLLYVSHPFHQSLGLGFALCSLSMVTGASGTS